MRRLWRAVRGLCGSTRRFVGAWDRDAWQLVVLAIPLWRALLYVVHLAPAQLNDEVIGPPWQVFALVGLGIGAAFGITGVMRNNLAVGGFETNLLLERMGMQLLGPLGLIYGILSAASDPHRGIPTFIAYTMIAACCFRRAYKITRLLRWATQIRRDAASRAAEA